MIKSNIISKIVHLLTALPTPPCFLKTVNKLIFSFLWDNKPDKVNRIQVCQEYKKGGLKMVDIYEFEKALKINWLKRKMCQIDAQWVSLFSEIYHGSDKLYTFGGDWAIESNIAEQNLFWISVFKSWKTFCQRNIPSNNTEIAQSCLWYNSLLSDTLLYFPNWHRKGINFVGDILKTNGNIMTREEMEDIYHFPINFLNYYKVCHSVIKFIQTFKKSDEFPIQKPFLPVNVKSLLISGKGCQSYYNILKSKTMNYSTSQRKWAEYLDTNSIDIWQIIFGNCFKTIKDNSIIWFQYKLLYGILPTRSYLKKIRKSECDKCALCKECEETIVHLF